MGDPFKGLLLIGQVLWARRLLICLASLLGALLGLAMASFWPLSYTAVCTVFLVQSMKAETQTQELLGSGPKANQAYASVILSSRTVAEDVLRNLKNKSLDSDQLRQGIGVSGSREGVLSVHYSSKDPAQATQILNEYLKAYRRYTDGSVLTVAKGERVFIEKQLQLCEERLTKAEEALVGFETRNGELPADSLTSAIKTAYGEQQTARSALTLIRTKARALEENSRKSLEQVETHNTAPSSLEDEALKAMQAQLVQARLDLANLKISSTDEDPEVKAQLEKIQHLETQVGSRLGELRSSLERGADRTASQLRVDEEMARVKLDEAESTLRTLKPKLKLNLTRDIERLRLRRDFEVQDKLYRDLKSAMQMAQLAEAKEPIYLVVLDQPAITQSRAQQYRQPIGAALGAGLGLSLSLLGLVLATLKRSWEKASA